MSKRISEVCMNQKTNYFLKMASEISSSIQKSAGVNVKSDVNKSCLVEIPLMPLPTIDCSNLGSLETTGFVNVVLEDGINGSRPFFRVSDDKNDEILRVTSLGHVCKGKRRKGVTYLECVDTKNNVILLIGYPVGLGEVALLSPNEELIGECMSNVEFLCLNVKVKYNYYDANGNRLMKMTALVPDNKEEGKFTLIVKRPKDEKLALIKMGSLQKCCHMKLKRDVATIMDRLQIIALWIGFMHNQMEDKVYDELCERREEMRRLRSQKSKSSSIENDNNNSQNGEIKSTETPSSSSSPSPTSSDVRSIGNKLRQFKKLVNSRLLPKNSESLQKNSKDNDTQEGKELNMISDSDRRDVVV